uniref:Amino acid transporter transmembrane domain-containing protein n=1 Tax=Chromera velia CCMP2878 TaxID=1169474 RepID=A0A0G4HM69_9ALVE|eukprot:Cvel_1162.t1-p1 / transcript=Cvel_1162.t1 / gene=Cvel_1162 / organism=Chromera_velia_CCMP2878 / gene_product=Vacuolar amino acid transporter 6, putative / transcript_product=Vacuolar amino acid transporter 6, putative / location=Cvel_scaffold38:119706-126507(+) / protein_length=857 / sequence_SO=supercontig / SO=protein_coding / is_pseudo=false
MFGRPTQSNLSPLEVQGTTGPSAEEALLEEQEDDTPDSLRSSFICPPPEDCSRRLGFWQAVRALIANIVGGTVLSFPFVFRSCGGILAPILVFSFALMMIFSLMLVTACSRKTGKIEYYEIARHLYGTSLEMIVAILVLIAVFLNTVAVIILSGDVATPLLKVWAGVEMTSWKLALVKGAVVATVSPLCFLSSLHALRHMNLVANAVAFLLILVVVIRSVQTFGKYHEVAVVSSTGQITSMQACSSSLRVTPSNALDLITSAPLMVSGFICHANVLRVHAEFRRPTKVRFYGVLWTAILYAALMYCLVGAFGYVYASCMTCGNILLNFPPEDVLAQVLRVLMGLIVLGNIPMQVLPGRKAFFFLAKNTRFLRQSIVFREPFRGCPHPVTVSGQALNSENQEQTAETLEATSYQPPRLVGAEESVFPPPTDVKRQQTFPPPTDVNRQQTAPADHQHTLEESQTKESLRPTTPPSMSERPSSAPMRQIPPPTLLPAQAPSIQNRSLDRNGVRGIRSPPTEKRPMPSLEGVGGSAGQLQSKSRAPLLGFCPGRLADSFAASLVAPYEDESSFPGASFLAHKTTKICAKCRKATCRNAVVVPAVEVVEGEPRTLVSDLENQLKSDVIRKLSAPHVPSAEFALPSPPSVEEYEPRPSVPLDPQVMGPPRLKSVSVPGPAAVVQARTRSESRGVPMALRLRSPVRQRGGEGEGGEGGTERTASTEAARFEGGQPTGRGGVGGVTEEEEIEVDTEVAIDPSVMAARWAFGVFTLMFVGAALAAAIFLQNIVTVYSFGGAFVSVSLAFILPAVMYLKIAQHEPLSLRHPFKVLSYFFLVIAVPLALLGVLRASVNFDAPSCPSAG